MGFNFEHSLFFIHFLIHSVAVYSLTHSPTFFLVAFEMAELKFLNQNHLSILIYIFGTLQDLCTHSFHIFYLFIYVIKKTKQKQSFFF